MSNPPVTAEDLYLYAMGLLDDAESQRLEAFLLQSPEARTELANVRGDLALLALTSEQQTPPALTRQRLLKQVARERKTSAAGAIPAVQAVAIPTPAPVPPQQSAQFPPQSLPKTRTGALTPIQPESYASTDTPLPFRSSHNEEETKPRRGFLGSVMPWAGWAVAAGLAVSTWSFCRRSETMQDQVTFANTNASRAKLTSAKAEEVLNTMRSAASQRFVLTKQNIQPVPSARVTYLAENGSLVFQGSSLDPLPPYKTYELWLIPAGAGRQPIPAGTFKPDDHGYASILLPELPKGVVAGTFGVTMEDDGGSATPTLPILMIGS